jgi:hypothetical protein
MYQAFFPVFSEGKEWRQKVDESVVQSGKCAWALGTFEHLQLLQDDLELAVRD